MSGLCKYQNLLAFSGIQPQKRLQLLLLLGRQQAVIQQDLERTHKQQHTSLGNAKHCLTCVPRLPTSHATVHLGWQTCLTEAPQRINHTQTTGCGCCLMSARTYATYIHMSWPTVSACSPQPVFSRDRHNPSATERKTTLVPHLHTACIGVP